MWIYCVVIFDTKTCSIGQVYFELKTLPPRSKIDYSALQCNP